MYLNFLNWHHKKEIIHNESFRPFFQERDIWWCSIGLNVGYEQNGKGEDFGRPIIIFRKFSNEVFWGIPLTTKIHSGKFYIPVNLEDKIARVATLSQLKLMDGKRLYQKMGFLNKKDHECITQGIMELCRGKRHENQR